MASILHYRRLVTHCRQALGASLLWLLLMPVTAQAATLSAFDARYHLSVDGWPDATVHHRLQPEGEHWLSDMRARVAVAEGQESARFLSQGAQLQAIGYASGYKLLGIGKRYQLNAPQLRQTPDRQTALIQLSRQVQQHGCSPSCELRYLDHKGEQERLIATPMASRRMEVQGRSIDAPRVRLADPDKDDRHMVVTFHPELAGLLLGVTYTKRGEQVSELALTSLTLP
ncbi:hypothetical protein ACSEE7_13890 [Halomonas cupida]|uniref:hypothetical protein n=1 Tax=Halomonas cupida TaxID=44933 RepID=UPI003EF9604A